MYWNLHQQKGRRRTFDCVHSSIINHHRETFRLPECRKRISFRMYWRDRWSQSLNFAHLKHAELLHTWLSFLIWSIYEMRQHFSVKINCLYCRLRREICSTSMLQYLNVESYMCVCVCWHRHSPCTQVWFNFVFNCRRSNIGRVFWIAGLNRFEKHILIIQVGDVHSTFDGGNVASVCDNNLVTLMKLTMNGQHCLMDGCYIE